MAQIKITALTADTLGRLRAILAQGSISEEKARLLEHLAYCANMGAETKAQAWARFVELVDRETDLRLRSRLHALEALGVARKAIEDGPARSYWKRGVKQYALELWDVLDEALMWGRVYPENLADRRFLRAVLLNGAENWEQYSYGGTALVYDEDVAERLCTPSELERLDHGYKSPNTRETWLDVQARALRQACEIVLHECGMVAADAMRRDAR